jgi:hypothetical protein
VPVLLFAYVCCTYARAELLLGLFLVEWIVIITAWRLLCPWLGRRSVAFAAVPFLLSFCVVAILAHENIAFYGVLWTSSDESLYLNDAGRVVNLLRTSGWNFSDAWAELTDVGFGAWTLAGWSFVLGVVSSFVTSDTSPEILHAIALSLNATFLTLVLALIFYLLEEPARRYPLIALLCFLLVFADPVVYSAQSRKESMLQLCLMLAFVLCIKLTGRIQIQWIILGLLGVAGVATTRPVYIPLILLVLYWLVLDKINVGASLKVLIGFIVIASFGSLIWAFQIREVPVAEFVVGRAVETDAGIASVIYNMPLIGPVLYYAISPVPTLPWKILSQGQIITVLTRGAGSVAWFCAICYVLQGVVRNRLLLKDNLFVAAAIMFVGVFTAVVIYSDDPRYKQPTNFYLAIMLFLTWYDKRMRRISDRARAIGNK